jgi:hypothetical protein
VRNPAEENVPSPGLNPTGISLPDSLLLTIRQTRLFLSVRHLRCCACNPCSREIGGGNVLLPLTRKLPSERNFSRVPAIAVIDAFQLVEAVRPMSALEPAGSGFEMTNVSQRQGSHGGMLTAREIK